jgi:hypothetical protein
MSIIREFIELNEAESTVDMFWDVLTAILEISDASSDKVLIKSIMDHTAYKALQTRSKMTLRSKIKGEARQRLIILLRTIEHAHKKLKGVGEIFVDKSVDADVKAEPKAEPKTKLKDVKEEKKLKAKEKIEPEKVEKKRERAADDDKTLTPDELPRIIKRMIELADPEDNKKLARTILGLSPMKILLTRARAVSTRVNSLVRQRMEDFEASLT